MGQEYFWCSQLEESSHLLIESMPKSWTETTPTSILLSITVFIIVPIIYALINNKAKK